MATHDDGSVKRKLAPHSNYTISDIEAAYVKANKHITSVRSTSYVESDIEEPCIKTTKRKRRLPARYRTNGDVDDIDEESSESFNLLKIKNVSDVLKISFQEEASSTEENGSTSKSNSLLGEYACSIPSTSQNDLQEVKSLLGKNLKLLEQSFLKMNTLEKKIDVIQAEIAEIRPLLAEKRRDNFIDVALSEPMSYEKLAICADVFSDFSLPLKSDKELTDFNTQLEESQEFQVQLARHLHVTCPGKSLTSFLRSVLKKLLAKDLAMQYSRIGRKGKKSFMVFQALYRTVLAAALLQFEQLTAADVDCTLGRVLALSSDWEGRPKKNSDIL